VAITAIRPRVWTPCRGPFLANWPLRSLPARSSHDYLHNFLHFERRSGRPELADPAFVRGNIMFRISSGKRAGFSEIGRRPCSISDLRLRRHRQPHTLLMQTTRALDTFLVPSASTAPSVRGNNSPRFGLPLIYLAPFDRLTAAPHARSVTVYILFSSVRLLGILLFLVMPNWRPRPHTTTRLWHHLGNVRYCLGPSVLTGGTGLLRVEWSPAASVWSARWQGCLRSRVAPLRHQCLPPFRKRGGLAPSWPATLVYPRICWPYTSPREADSHMGPESEAAVMCSRQHVGAVRMARSFIPCPEEAEILVAGLRLVRRPSRQADRPGIDPRARAPFSGGSGAVIPILAGRLMQHPSGSST